MRLILFLSFAIANVCVIADEPKTRVIEGVVTDSKGKPIKGAAVEWGHFQSDRKAREVFRTDDEGRYRVETKKIGPDFRLGVSVSGYAPSWRDGLIPRVDGDHGKMDFKLSRPLTLKGVVVDEKGVPIEGVTVVAKSPVSGFYSSFSSPTPSFPYPGPPRQGTTDGDGRFTIRNLPASFMMAKDADRGHPFELSIKTASGSMPRGKGYQEEDNKITINRSYVQETARSTSGEISAVVIDSVSEKPITEFKHVRRHVPAMIQHKDPDGKFVLTGLTMGRPYQIWVYADGYEPFVFRISPRPSGKSVPHRCELRPSPGLVGDIVDAQGRPIAGAEVVVGIQKSKHSANRFHWGAFDKIVDGHMGLEAVQRMTTRADGQFVFSQGEHPAQVAVIAPGYVRRFVNVSQREKMMKDGRLRIELEKESVLRGTVLLKGKPETNAKLWLAQMSQPELDFGELRANENGEFEIRNLLPGEYQLSVYQYSGSKGTVRLSRRFDLEPAKTTTMKMDNPGGKCTLSGRAQPFGLITLSVVKLKDGEAEYSNIGTTVSADGYYRIEGLHEGQYTIEAKNPSALNTFGSSPSRRKVDVDGFTMLDLTDPLVKFSTSVKTGE